MRQRLEILIAALIVLGAGSGIFALGQVSEESSTEPSGSIASTNARSKEYVIGANDLLEIEVFELDQFKTVRRVPEDGVITLPLIGEIKVGGLTPHEAEEEIERELRAREQLKRPEVSVFVREYVSSRISIQGAVKTPGPLDLLGEHKLLEMIGQAGGLDPRVGRKIFVLRKLPSGGEKRIEIDIERLVYQANPVLNILMMPGDIVTIPYEKKIRIYVNGAVQNPGVHEFLYDEPVTVLQAVTTAGGTTDRANESRVSVLRQDPDGTKQLFAVNLKRIKRRKDDDMLLKPNDIVVVRESFF